MNEEKEDKIIITLPKPVPPREIYWKVHDLFVREFKWPSQMLKFSDKKIIFQFNYHISFKENLKNLKETFGLTDKEIASFNNYETEFIIHQLESTNYKNKEILSKIYGKEFFFEDTSYFIPVLGYLIKHVEKLDKEFKIYDEEGGFVYHYHRLLIGILMVVCFEYACKGLLLSNDYKINEYKIQKKPIKNINDVKAELNLNRTISLSESWDFIKERNFMKFSEEEIITGNYLCFSRNRQIHTPSWMASRGNYNIKSISLIKKILAEIKKSFYYKKYSVENEN